MKKMTEAYQFSKEDIDTINSILKLTGIKTPTILFNNALNLYREIYKELEKNPEYRVVRVVDLETESNQTFKGFYTNPDDPKIFIGK